MNKQIKIALTLVSLSILGSTLSYADQPDYYQNSSSNNIAYDLPEKFYAGVNLGYGSFGDKTFNVLNQNIPLHGNSLNAGIFGGYKFNNYAALETSFQRLGQLNDPDSSLPLPLIYQATIYNLSLDGILSYPLQSGEQETTSIYGKAGYGINFTKYHYSVLNDAISNSGSLNKGAYNFGLGFNMDFRSNLSARLGYTYYQTNYPLFNNNTQHGANVFAIALYYNF